ncbi:CHAT domain-containing protein [Streptomyces justiciae]|uniref:CHAT domain-containing protein n=1 Tax=Streptomyces justiciae TaxID=2780140 RepID=A0ABU3LKC4_9ACTN|nr:CHAT domain-containing protein [Streptomyces justiciae]MDT7839608.1 CHAT domain-containing protein [Streptomyces justiciae]
MTELRGRVVARLVTAQNTRDPAPLRDPEAVADALALLRQAAPAPEAPVDLEAVVQVFWTFWFRHLGDDDPEAEQNLSVIVGTFVHLCPRLPPEAGLPQVLVERFDPADPSNEASFAYLVSRAHTDAAVTGPQEERPAALAAAIAWSESAFESVLDEDHAGFLELTVHALELHVERFKLMVDPDALLVAVRYARAVCARLSAVAPSALDPALVQAAAAPALRTLVDTCRLLGTPPLTVVEELIAAVPQGALLPETAEGLDQLRHLHTLPVTWPGEFDLRVGSAIADAGIAEDDPGRVACAVRRLRASLAATPTVHPAHPQVVTTLGQALAALAAAREDGASAVEAAELLASVGALDDRHRDMIDAYRQLQDLSVDTVTPEDLERMLPLLDGLDLSDEQREMFAAFRELQEASRSDDPVDLERVAPLIRRLAERAREQALLDGAPVDIDIELAFLSTGFEPDDSGDEHIARYRTALAALPADQPHRHAYVAVLAALTGMRAEALRDSAPARAGLFEAECRELTEEALAAAPAGSPVSELLRQGLFEVALPVAVASTETGGVPDGELGRMVEVLTRMGGVRLEGSETLDADIATIRELRDLTPEGDEMRPYLSAALGSALSAQTAQAPDYAVLEEVVELLRESREQGVDLPGDFDRMLADALTVLSFRGFDAEGAREAAALIASAPGGLLMPEIEGELRPGDPMVTETDRAVLAARTEFHNALQNYIFGHEPAQLERAMQIARRMRDVIEAAPVTAERPWYDLMGDVYVNLADTVGPAGGRRPDLDDAVVEECRATFARCGPGHPMRVMAASTLARALAQRAVVLRATEPARAQELFAEADEVTRSLSAEELPQGAPFDLAGVMRSALDFFVRGRLPDPTPGEDGTPQDLLAARLAPVLGRFDGTAGPEVLRGGAVPVWLRAHGEIGAAAGALGRQEIGPALDHLEEAIEAMAGLTDRGADQTSAEHGLSSFEGDIRTIVELILCNVELRDVAPRLPEYLKAAQESVRELEAGRVPPELPTIDRSFAGRDVDRAAELLERGRGLLLTRRIEARADLGELRTQHPELADEFERLTEQIEARPQTSAPGDAEWSRLARLRASRALDDLVRDIRARPGFEGFLRPLTARELKELAADGPVVVLNHGGKRYCHALVVTDRTITTLPLEVTAEEAADMSRWLREAVDAINTQGGSRPAPLQLVAAGNTVRQTLDWTWHKIVRPVLEAVGCADAVPGDAEWPRIWWVPTGAFGALPLHAAECRSPDCAPDGCGAALDAVVSSYVPGLQTLAYARARARQRGTAEHGRALLVAAAEDDLPGVAGAADYAAGLLGAHRTLIGPEATRDVVLSALHEASWAHFGCHAATDPSEPSGALLHLPSGEQVSVREICQVRPRAAQLAFLAACGTARTTEHLSDEAIHITSSFLLAGFPTAVGTLWKIDSTHADQVTRDFYRRTTAPGTPGPARALHDTIRELRARVPHPHIWAAYVHAGP